MHAVVVNVVLFLVLSILEYENIHIEIFCVLMELLGSYCVTLFIKILQVLFYLWQCHVNIQGHLQTYSKCLLYSQNGR